jgi:hypothetical protein
MTTIYQDVLALGVPIDHHVSDLYFQITPESQAALRRYVVQAVANGLPSRYTIFNDGFGRAWAEVPFAYDPYWTNKETTR